MNKIYRGIIWFISLIDAIWFFSKLIISNKFSEIVEFFIGCSKCKSLSKENVLDKCATHRGEYSKLKNCADFRTRMYVKYIYRGDKFGLCIGRIVSSAPKNTVRILEGNFSMNFGSYNYLGLGMVWTPSLIPIVDRDQGHHL